MSQSKKSACPQCQSEIIIRDKFYPFCSERCQLLDLGAWAEGKYRIAAVENEEMEEADLEDEYKDNN
jgi:uncharacterized protein